jgi:hypothetical protein
VTNNRRERPIWQVVVDLGSTAHGSHKEEHFEDEVMATRRFRELEMHYRIEKSSQQSSFRTTENFVIFNWKSGRRVYHASIRLSRQSLQLGPPAVPE